MNRYAWAMLLLSPLVLCGSYCGPQPSMNASVQVAPGPPDRTDTEVYAAGEPIDDARIEYVCDEGSETLFAPEDADAGYDSVHIEAENGRIHFFDPRPPADRRGWDKACAIRVTHPDYYPQRFRIDELCLDTYPEREICERIAIQAELVPRTEESDGDTEIRRSTSAELPPVEWEEDPGPPPRLEPGLFAYAFFVLQASALLYALPARWTAGAYIAGVYTGSFSALLAVPALSSTDTLLLLVPAAASGLLSYYNFRYASEHSASRKFWTNFAGQNATFLPILVAPYVTGVVRRAFDDTLGATAAGGAESDFEFGFTGTGVMLNVRF